MPVRQDFSEAGFTLVELIAVVAVLVILISLGAPAFLGWRDDIRLSSYTNELHGALNLTRSEAIRRGQRVTVCVSRDGAFCANDVHWDAGWVLFVDQNGNARRDADEVLIRSGVYPATGLSARGNGTMTRYVSYVPSGTTRAVSGALQMGSIRICGERAQRTLVVSVSGRVRVQRGGPCL